MRLKGKACFKESSRRRGPSGSFSGREERKTEKKVSCQDQNLEYSVTRTHYVHVSMCSRVHVQPEIKFRGVRQQQVGMSRSQVQHLSVSMKSILLQPTT